MYRRTNPQVSFLSPLAGLPEAQQRRIRQTWAEGFREKVYPLLLRVEDEFAALYDAEVGRPNWSVARMLAITILQEMLNLHDQEALDEVAFDVRWQYALDLWEDKAYLSRRSFVNFRARMAAQFPDGSGMRKVFDEVLRGALAELKLSTKEQRLDSTQILSNIHTRGRADLFGKTLDHFLKALAREAKDRCDKLPAALLAWSMQAGDGVFGWQTATEASARLPQLAQWLVTVRDLFADDPVVRELEAYQLVVRLIAEQITVLPAETAPTNEADGEGSGAPSGGSSEAAEPRVELHRPESPGTSLQSPYDPDAGYGHKGPGYHVQIAETVGNEKTELILDYEVHGAGVSDQGKAAETLDRLAERNLTPEVLLADSGYLSSEALADAESRHIDLKGPIQKGPLRADAIGRDQWQRDPETGHLARCPQGQEVVRHGVRSNPNNEKTLHAFMPGPVCRACPIRDRCLARPSNNGRSGRYHIEDSPLLQRRDARLRAQQDPEWKRGYRKRAGIEGTNSELKRAHGLGRLRVRRGPRVRHAVAAKLTACNVKRWLRASAG